MKKKIFSAIVLCTIAMSAMAQSNTERLFHLSFISPMGTNGIQSNRVTNRISLNILGGYSYGNRAFELGGLYNVNARLTKGVQVAGLVNYSGKAYGAVQVSGITNIASDGNASVQISGVANVAKGANVQIGGVVNTAKRANLQIGSVLNVAKHLKGVQIGLINYADSCDGVAIGLINIVKHGGKHEFEVSFSESLNTAISFKLGTDNFYTIFSVGANYFKKPIQYAYGLGFGTHQNWGRRWGSQVEAVGYQLSEDGKFRGGLDLLTQLKFTVSKQFANHFKIFAGPVLNMTISDYVNPQTGSVGSSLAPYSLWDRQIGKTKLNAWVGFTAGVRF